MASEEKPDLNKINNNKSQQNPESVEVSFSLGAKLLIGTVMTILMGITGSVLYLEYGGDCAAFGPKLEQIVCGRKITYVSETSPYTGEKLIVMDESLDNRDDKNNQIIKETQETEEILEQNKPEISKESEESKEPLEEDFEESTQVFKDKDSETKVNIEIDNLSKSNQELGQEADQEPGQELIDGAQVVVPIYETPALLIANNKKIISSTKAAKIKSFPYKDGQEFKQGDILIAFDCELEKYDIEIQKELQKQAEIKLENLQKLDKLNAVSNQDVMQAKSELELVKRQIEKLNEQIKDCIISADYSGKVITAQGTEQTFVNPGTELMTINNNKDLLVKAYIPVSWLAWVQIGTRFELCLDLDNCHKGVIHRIGAEVDATSQTIDVFGKLLEMDSLDLIAGVSGQVKFDKEM